MAGKREALRTMLHILTARRTNRKAVMQAVERQYAEDLAALKAFYSNPVNHLETEAS